MREKDGIHSRGGQPTSPVKLLSILSIDTRLWRMGCVTEADSGRPLR